MIRNTFLPLTSRFLSHYFKFQFSVSMKECQLVSKTQINYNTFLFKLAFNDKNDKIDLKIGQHINLILNREQKEKESLIFRKYTPVSKIDALGYVDLMIKIYKKDGDFPGGKFTSQLDKIQIGEKLYVYGPYGRLAYEGNGKFIIGPIPMEKKYKKIGLIAGGSGLSPIYQIIQAIGDSEHDTTEVTLLLANRKEEDMVLRKELEAYAEKKKLKIFYTLDRANSDWKGWIGYVTKEMLEKVFWKHDNDGLICMCGPRLMTDNCLKYLSEIGHQKYNLYKF